MKTPFLQSFKGDKVIWRVVLALSVVSLLAIYSSSSSLAYLKGGTTFEYLLRHFRFVAISIFAIYVVHNIPIAWYRMFAKIILCVSVGLLVLTIVAGVTLNEGTRWLRIPVIGLTFQPADFAKIGIVLYIAKVLEEGGLDTFKKFCIKILVPVAIVCALTLKGSVSATVLLGFTVFVLFYVAGIRYAYMVRTLGLALLALALVVGISQIFPTIFPRLSTTAITRIFNYTSRDDADQEGANFQPHKADVAVASGGLIGKGPGNSTQRHILPHPYSDYVYAIIIEEYGLLGGFVVLMLYLILLYRAVVIARSCTRIFSATTVLGLMLFIVIQAMINMGVAVGIFPVTGQTLPFVSLGGSSLVTTGLALGVILSISRATEERNMPQAKVKVKEKEVAPVVIN
jgi:cell division protein FtsW